MEINRVSSKAYTSSASAIEEDEQQNEEVQAHEFGVTPQEEEQKDIVQISTSDFEENNVQEKVSAYIQNIVFTENLTEDSKNALNNYLNTFDVAKFIKMYGPFSSSAEISAAMYAVTSGMIKYQE